MIHRTEHNEDFTVISNNAIRDDRLSFEARGFLAFLLSMVDNWNFSISGLASVTGLSEKSIMRLTKELKSLGYIKQTKIKDANGYFRNYLWEVFEEPSSEVTKNGTSVKPNFRKTEVPLNRTSEEPNFRKTEAIRNTNIEEIPNIRNTNKKERSIAKFKKPTLEEVIEYCKERNNNVDPVKFYDYFEAGEWKDANGKPVKNWKQKIITWERFSPAKPKAEAPDASKIDEALSIALRRAEGN